MKLSKLAMDFVLKYHIHSINSNRVSILFANFNRKNKQKLKILAKKKLIDFAKFDLNKLEVNIYIDITYTNSHQNFIAKLRFNFFDGINREINEYNLVAKHLIRDNYKFCIPQNP